MKNENLDMLGPNTSSDTKLIFFFRISLFIMKQNFGLILLFSDKRQLSVENHLPG